MKLKAAGLQATYSIPISEYFTQHVDPVTGAAVFQCRICHKPASRANRRRHLNDTHASAAFPCSQCGAVYRSKTTLRQHVKNFHPGGTSATHGQSSADTSQSAESTSTSRNLDSSVISPVASKIGPHLLPQSQSSKYINPSYGGKTQTHIRSNSSQKPHSQSQSGKTPTDSNKTIADIQSSLAALSQTSESQRPFQGIGSVAKQGSNSNVSQSMDASEQPQTEELRVLSEPLFKTETD